MNLAILHYHLNRGGVTRVIENHLRVLNETKPTDDPTRVMILHGGRDNGWPENFTVPNVELTIQAVDGLDYDALSSADQPELSENLTTALGNAGFSPENTLLHIHNHGMAKNASFPKVLHQLASAGYRCLLQIHDFAEDFRPLNYRELSETYHADERALFVYPQASHIHYAVLNQRDFRVLADAGVPSKRLHFLPNPVPEVGELPDKIAAREQLSSVVGIPDDRPLFVYPVRGIRRKNVGEMVLWSAVHRKESAFAITLAPENPRELEWYQHWQKLSTEHGLPCWWDLGGHVDYPTVLAACDAIQTTSVAEGFGMVFLEAWLAGRPLVGRNLPSITADFVAEGMQFPALADEFRIPADWIAPTDYRSALESTLNPLLADFRQSTLDGSQLDELIAERTADGTLDFGDLNEPLQTRVIEKVLEDPTAADRLRDLNPVLALDFQNASQPIPHNQNIIREIYSLAGSRRKLQAVYKAVEKSPRGEITPINNADAVLSAFLDPRKFRMIRS